MIRIVQNNSQYLKNLNKFSNNNIRFNNLFIQKYGNITDENFDDKFFSFCIIGSGPAAFMCAKQILNTYTNASVHLFEKQPFPFGLIRYGVAPDHLPIKNVQKELSQIAQNEDFHFFGNVHIGKDIEINELKSYYSSIIYAYGADSDRQLGIKGEQNTKNVFGAIQLVNWYNKHPDYVNFKPEIEKVKNLTIIGNGNVAIDIARIFVKDREQLKETEISESAFQQLEQTQINNVFLVGRRGIVQSAFNLKDLRALNNLKNTKIYVFEKDLQINAASTEEITPSNLNFNPKSRANKRKYEFLVSKLNYIKDQQHFEQIKNDTSHKKIFLMYNLSPQEIISNSENYIESVKLVKTELEGDAYQQTCRNTDEIVEIQSDMLVRSIGYKSQRINKEAGWNEKQQIIQHSNGCVQDNENQIIKGHYVAGWIKTGPIGVLDTTYVSSIETCNNIFNHMNQGIMESKEDPLNEITDLLLDKGIQFINFKDWELVDEEEIKKGQESNKIRSKLVSKEEVFQVLKDAYPFTCQK